MVKEGYYFGLPPLALGAAALFLRWTFAGIILLCLAAFIFYFFRDPERIIPADPGAFVSPADLWLPRDSELLVKVGDHVKGGSSVVAYWPPRAKSTQPRGAQTQSSSEENLSPAEKRT